MQCRSRADPRSADVARVDRAPPPRAVPPGRRRDRGDRDPARAGRHLARARPRRRPAPLHARAGRSGGVLDGGVVRSRRGGARVAAHAHAAAALQARRASRGLRLVLAERSRSCAAHSSRERSPPRGRAYASPSRSGSWPSSCCSSSPGSIRPPTSSAGCSSRRPPQPAPSRLERSGLLRRRATLRRTRAGT
jgi:hypothetical protein